MRILIVEDEPITALEFQLTLGDLGHDTSQVAASGELAVRMARQEAPDCVVMDFRLAGEMNGIEAAHLIRAHWNVPVVFVSALDLEGKPDADLGKGVVFLSKPITGEQLSQAVQSVVSAALDE